MSDPLSLLREQFINKKPISHDDAFITIGDLKFPRNTLTAYKQDRGRGDPYPLEALYYLLQKPHLAGAAKTRQYAEECNIHKFQRVLLADQKDVLAYLTGKQETSQYLVSVEELTSLAVPQSQEVPVQAKAAEKAGEKRKREPMLDLTDEKIIQAKRELAEELDGMAPKPLNGPEEKKKARLPVHCFEKVDDIPLTTSPYILADGAVTRALIEKERSHLTRTTCLHTANGKDLKHLDEILRGAIARRGTNKKAAAAGSNRPAASTQNPPPGQRRDRYNVSGVEAFKAAGMDADLLRAQQQGSSLLSSSQNDKGSSSGGGGGAKSDKDGSSKASAVAQAKRLNINMEPIIIVPQAASAAITKWNVKDLLEKGVYRTREEQKKAGYKPEDRVSIIHQEEGASGMHSYHYKVVDSVDAMKKEDWHRVFLQGPEWQFKGWDLSCYGGKMVFDKDQPHENVRKYTVKLLQMSRLNRHLDTQVRMNFWDQLKSQHRLASQIREKAKASNAAR